MTTVHPPSIFRRIPNLLLPLAAPILLSAILHAQPIYHPFALAKIQRTDATILQTLVSERADIDHIDAQSVEVYFTREEFDQARARGWQIQWEYDESIDYWFELQKLGIEKDEPLLSYHTYAELSARLANFAVQYPELCRVESAGQSVEGRELWTVQLAANPDEIGDRPEVKLVATMHGDEILGTEVLLDTIERLLDGYGTDSRLTAILDDTVLWIMPLMNPDGWEMTPPSRRNANVVDLNRNFPSWVCGEENTTISREPETAVVMEWSAARNPVLSISFHGGALVVNYPYDECSICNTSCSSSISPDHDTLRSLSLMYSFAHDRMYNESSFPDNGVVNGAAWYSIYGGMGDWNYRWMGAFELTVELDVAKIPNVTRLPDLIAENREPVLQFIEAAQTGIRGVVTNVETGSPLEASIQVVGRNFVCYTNPLAGNYHRIIMPGTYDLLVTAEGFDDPVLVEDVVVSEGAATRVDIEFGELLSSAGMHWLLY